MMRDSRVTVILLVGAAAVWSVAAALSALPPPPQPPQWMIDTIAGAEEGALARPTGIALARDGTLYAADSRNYRVVKLDADGNAVVASRAALLDSSHNVVFASNDHLLAVVGMDDCIIVHTGDATLVCNKSDSQRLKELVDMIATQFGPGYL